MQDVKLWLEKAGEPVAETAFTDGASYPYIVYLDTQEHSGADTKNLIVHHSMTVERYSQTNEDNPKLEALFDEKPVEYTKEKTWLKDIECYMTTYDFDFTEKQEG